MLDNIIAHSNPNTLTAEAYRGIRTNIQFLSAGKPFKSIVITSAGPMEGKTTTISNLAVSFAQLGKKVLLVDADFHKPKINRVFILPNERGLANLITSHEEYDGFIRKTSLPGLDIITSGIIPPNPSELLNSNAMKQFVFAMTKTYDLVLIDAPPVGSLTDAAIISTYADGTIIVAKSNSVEIDALKRAKEVLASVNANIIGVILNRTSRKGEGLFYSSSSDHGDSRRRKREIKTGA